MATYDNLINTVSNAYARADASLAAIPTDANVNPGEFAKRLLFAQIDVNRAAELQNRVAAAIDTASRAQSSAANR
jgi:hypothetical protein